jgi:hypothetical protein
MATARMTVMVRMTVTIMMSQIESKGMGKVMGRDNK